MFKNLFKYLLNVFYPLNCPICDKRLNPLQENVLCENCAGNLSLFEDTRCVICGQPLPADSPNLTKRCSPCQAKKHYFNRAATLGPYAGILEKCICTVKYRKNARLAKSLGKLMAGNMLKLLDINQIDVIVPVPLQRGKLKERQFNQAYLLGEVISQKFNIPINHRGLRKIKNTHSQVGLSDFQRKRNLRGAFRVKDAQCFKGKHVLLVDDVFTTGATADECAKTLKNSQAKMVTVYTLAKTVPKF